MLSSARMPEGASIRAMDKSLVRLVAVHCVPGEVAEAARVVRICRVIGRDAEGCRLERFAK